MQSLFLALDGNFWLKMKDKSLSAMMGKIELGGGRAYCMEPLTYKEEIMKHKPIKEVCCVDIILWVGQN